MRRFKLLMSLMVVCAGLGLGAATPAVGQAVVDQMNLRPKFVEGQTSRYSIWSKRTTDVTMNFGSQSDEARRVIENEGEVTWEVGRVRSDGSATCMMTIDWLTVAITPPGGGEAQLSDSRKRTGPNESLQNMLRAITGVPLSVEVSVDGTMTKLRGVDKMQKQLGKDGQVPSEQQFLETAATLATLAGVPTSIKTGGKWNVEQTWSREGGEVVEKMNYVVGSMERIENVDVVTVNGSAKLDFKPDRSKMPKDGPKVDIKQTVGEMDVQVMFDLYRGEVIGRNAVETRRVEVTIHGPDNRKFKQISQETEHSQALRIGEGEQ